jgi:hypothetical protein
VSPDAEQGDGVFATAFDTNEGRRRNRRPTTGSNDRGATVQVPHDPGGRRQPRRDLAGPVQPTSWWVHLGCEHRPNLRQRHAIGMAGQQIADGGG